MQTSNQQQYSNCALAAYKLVANQENAAIDQRSKWLHNEHMNGEFRDQNFKNKQVIFNSLHDSCRNNHSFHNNKCSKHNPCNYLWRNLDT